MHPPPPPPTFPPKLHNSQKSSFGAFGSRKKSSLWSLPKTGKNLYLEVPESSNSSFGTFRSWKNPHLDSSIASNSLFQSIRCFETSIKQMQLQYLYHESFVASELTLITSSDYGLLSCNKLSQQAFSTSFISLYNLNKKNMLSLVGSLSTNLMSFWWSNLLDHLASSLSWPLCCHKAV